MKLMLMGLLLISSIESFALFDDKTIEPFLGPYKIQKNSTRNCPKNLLLIAMCSLSELSLKNTHNPDFDFLKFKGINEGLMITKNKNQEVKRSNTVFEKLQLSSTQETFQKRFNNWFETKVTLSLKKKEFHLKKFQNYKNKSKQSLILDCQYSFDDIEHKKTLQSFNSK